VHEPVLYSPHAHHIDASLIDPDALEVIRKLQDHGHAAYLVGGGVRDLLSGVTPKDFDVSTSARPEEVKKVFGRRCLLIGRRFRLAHIRFGKKVIEVATFRRRDSDEGELIVEDNAWGTPEEDALRRDFTLNGLFYNPLDETIIDFVGGVRDLERRTLVSIGDPLIRFREDPVRMIRLLKFKARFGFLIDDETERALNTLKEDIIKSSEARVLEEIMRMLESGHSSSFFRLLQSSGLLHLIFPHLIPFMEGEEGETIFAYLSKADLIQNQFGKSALERPILTACLLFPIFEKELKAAQASSEQPLHLGEITLAVHKLIHEVVTTSFSRFPKRLSALMSQVMINQFRLTPLIPKKGGFKWRFIESRDFPDALKLLKIRSLLQPELKEIYAKWMEAFKEKAHKGERAPRQHQWHHPKKKWSGGNR
jgi:poly(A) polymerase